MNRISYILFMVLLTMQQVTGQNIFSVSGNRTMLNGKAFQVIGLRCSNALLSDATVDSLLNHLDEYKEYGINTISVYLMGSRYSNINGYELDGHLKEIYQQRMARIIEACDQRKMVVLVGILYWGAQQRNLFNAHYASWRQDQVNDAMVNTVEWLKENRYRNVFIDPDNEGMAERGAGFKIDEMICKGKQVDETICIAYNRNGFAPPCADLTIHHAKIMEGMPYIQTEGTPSQYWGDYSKEKGLEHYINVGIYTEGKKAEQIADTQEMLDAGHGYMFASTWLQNIPPNYHLGGDGSPCDPGMHWWLKFIKENYK